MNNTVKFNENRNMCRRCMCQQRQMLTFNCIFLD